MKTSTSNLRAAFATVNAAVLSGTSDRVALWQFEKSRRAAGPATLMSLDARFRSREFNAPSQRGSFLTLFQRRGSPVEILEMNGDFASVLIHSRDGRLREQAVRALIAPENDPLNLAALICRCNDWVPSVRDVALQRLRKIAALPRIDALQTLLPFLLERVPTWGRGGAEALVVLSQRADWRRLLETMFLEEVNGPLARQLRLALRRADMDAALPGLAVSAPSSFVRAVATDVTLAGQARWQDGREAVWIDKPMGIKRMRTVWAYRDVHRDAQAVERVLKSAANDKSASVRKLAADHLIRVGPTGKAALAERLTQDRSRAVRERMDYYKRKWLACDGQNCVSKDDD